jgi:biotin synthase-like enzyme
MNEPSLAPRVERNETSETKPVAPLKAAAIRRDWTVEEARALYELPFFALIDRAREVHRAHHDDGAVQLCTLLSVKTGGCPEDCGYCPQSSHHETSVGREKMLGVDEVIAAARRAKEHGSTRFCMGAAWREVKDGPAFERVVDMVRGVKVARPRGVLHARHAERPSRRAPERGGARRLQPQPRHVARRPTSSIISTRTFDERLSTLRAVRSAGITRVLGRHHRHGRVDRRSHGLDAGRARALDPSPGERPHQRPRARRGHARSSQPPRSIRSSSCA